MTPRLVLVALALVLAGCASAQQTSAPAGTTQTTDLISPESSYRMQLTSLSAGTVVVAAPMERVWAALPLVYAELELQGRPLDATQGVFGQPQTTIRRRLAGAAASRYLDCGSRAGIVNADSYSVTLTITTQVRAHGADATQLRTEIQANGRPPGSSDPPVRCGSTNALERRIEDLVSQHVGAAR
jgi:hypothetical protein